MEVPVMRQLPTPFSTYEPRPQWASRKRLLPVEYDQSPYRPYDYPLPQQRFRYPPSPPMERHSHTSLPPISTLLGNIRDSQRESGK